jgi:TolB-like protein/Tfp pilus assembly protein PilF
MEFFGELRRREVFGTAAYYFAISWGFIEILEWVLERWQISPPEWVMPLLATALVVGFPVSMFLAWMYDLDRTGIHRTAPSGRKGAATLLMAAVLMIGGTAGLYYLIGSPETPEIRLPPTVHPKLALLPLESFGSDPEDAEFADAIHYELLNNLSRIGSLRVISRQSVMEYRDSTRSLPEIATDLDVDALMTGAVRRAGDRMRIHLALRDGRTDLQVWDEEFDFTFTPEKFFEVQSDVAETIAAEFELALSEPDRIRLGRAHTRDLTAYDAYLLGQLKGQSGKVTDIEAAIELFNDAIRVDPEFALAYVGLAVAYNALRGSATLPYEEWVESAKPLLDRALELDDKLPEAYAALGWWYWRQGRPDEAEAAYTHALELGPGSASLYSAYGAFLYSARHLPEEAEVFKRKALELNPRSDGLHMSLVYQLEDMGRLDEARHHALKAIELQPANISAHWFLGLIELWGFVNYGPGMEYLEQAADMDPMSPLAPGFLTFAALDLGDLDAAQRWAAEAWTRAPNKWMSCAPRVMIARYRGQVENELACLRVMLAEDNRGYLALRELRNLDLRVGRADETIARYREVRPELFDPDGPQVNKNNTQQAIDLSLALVRQGETETANELLRLALEVTKGRPRLSSGGFGWIDVEALALLGRTEDAIAAMRGAIDEGMRLGWWILPANENLASIRDRPEFREMLDELEMDMSARRAALQTGQ